MSASILPLIDERPAIYVAGRYERKAELAKLAPRLDTLGYQVLSSWLGEESLIEADLTFKAKQQIAARDMQELVASDVVLCFTERPDVGYPRGGRHVEFGAALLSGAHIVLVGPLENVFHCLPNLDVFDTFEAAVPHLTTKLKELTDAQPKLVVQ